ncbi:MAG: hypothetical protein LBU66_03105 [Treponema sp.]|jgi:phage repressor protein C with HTH and peptisase S24 domain|nr:hypothetical protein [Treponema sp.]
MSSKKEKIFYESLEKLKNAYGKNTVEIEKFLGLSNGYISKIDKNPGKLFIALSEKGISIDWFLTGEGEMYLSKQEKPHESAYKRGFKRLPVYNEKEIPKSSFTVPLLDIKYSAGEGLDLPEQEEVDTLIPVPAYLSGYKDKIAAIKVDGDSMYPTLSRGDMVVCDSLGWSGEGIYAIDDHGTGFIKRITMAEGKYVIISDNPKYAPREIPEKGNNFRLIGRVHCAIKRVE